MARTLGQFTFPNGLGTPTSQAHLLPPCLIQQLYFPHIRSKGLGQKSVTQQLLAIGLLFKALL